MNLGHLRRTLPAADATAVGVVERDGGIFHLFSDGGLLPVVRGGAPDDDDPDTNKDKDKPKTYTQADLDRMLAREKDQGERAGEAKGMRKALEQLGVDPDKVKPEDLKDTLARARKAEEDAKTEAQREKDAAAQEKTAAQREKDAAALERHTAAVERYLVRAGVGAGETDDAKAAKAIERAARLVDVELGAEPEKIQAAVAELKTDMPALFGATSGGEQPDGDPKVNPKPNPTGKSSVAKGREEAIKRGWIKDTEKQTA